MLQSWFHPASWCLYSRTVRRSFTLMALTAMVCLWACGGGDSDGGDSAGGDSNGPASGDPTVASISTGSSSQRPVYHLIETFGTADLEREVKGLELGTPEARPHLLSGWGGDESDDSRSFVWSLGETSVFELFLTDAFDSQLFMHGRAFHFEGAEPQSMEVMVNGQSAGELQVYKDFAYHRLDIPAERLQVGVNRFELRYAQHHRPSQVIAGAEDDRPLAALWYSLHLRGSVEAEEPKVVDESMVLPLGNRVSTFQDIQPGDELVLGAIDTVGGVALRVELETADGVEIWEPSPSTDGAPQRWTLPVEATQLARLSFAGHRAQVSLGSRLRAWFGDGAQATVLLPVVLRPQNDDASERPDHSEESEDPVTAGEAVNVSSPGGVSPDGMPPDIVVYLIDTLRADRLGTYGYERPTSPRIDTFAEQGIVFTHAQAQSSWTRTAVTSLFTGMLPQAHGVNRRDEALAPQLTTMAEALKEQGYDTVGFITNGNVDAAFGLDQGFDHYQYLRESEDNVFFHQTAERLNSWVFKWLDTLAPRGQRPPFFLYVHATDPHAPYTPPDGYYERFAADVDRQRGWLEHVHDISAGRLDAPEGTAEAWSALYDGEIAYTDHHFGRLLDRLQTMGLEDSSTVVLVSDHGEEFFEHGGWEHGKTLYGEQLRVPLILRLPGGEGAGQRLSILANQMDVLPTLLDYAGAEVPELVQGQSLLPWVRRAAQFDKDPAYAYLRLGDRHQQSIVDREFKLIVDATRRPPGQQLFHLAIDLDETRDVARQFDVEQGFLGQSLRRLEAGLRGRGTSASKVEVDEDLRRRLEALGYVDN